MRCKKFRSELSVNEATRAGKEKSAELEAALDSQRHIKELEQALLIAAESEAVRMDMGTLRLCKTDHT